MSGSRLTKDGKIVSAGAGGTSKDSNLIAAITYAGVFFYPIPIITYLLKKEDSFVRFHSVQALGIIAVELIVSIVLMSVMMITSFAAPFLMFISPEIGTLAMLLSFLVWIIIFPLFFLFFFAMMGISIWFMYRAYNGEQFKLPFIGKIAEQYSQ